MAFFKFRSPAASAAAAGGAGGSVSIETLRRRARHRLIGATLLVILGIVLFPILFDTQPRPIPVDIAIDIPDRNKVKPLALPAQADPVASQARGATAPSAPAVKALAAASGVAQPAAPAAEPAPTPSRVAAPSVPAAASLEAREQIVDNKPATSPTSSARPANPAARDAAPASPQASAAAAAPASPSAPRASATVPAASRSPAPVRDADGERARALLEGRAPDKAAPEKAAAASTDTAGARFIVQVGAYAEADRVRDVRARLERAGLKTYVHVIDTPDGKRTRVRLGPYATRAEADAAAAKARGLDLAGSVLSL